MAPSSPLPSHDLVRVLRPERTYLLRNAQTGGLLVARRLGSTLAAAGRRLRALARAEHPRLGPAASALAEGAAVWGVRPWVEGRPLSESLRAGPLDPIIALAVFRDVAGALAALHARGAIHGEVHPGNVICDLVGRAHLVDGGDPLRLPPDAADAFSVEEASYAAPELLRGRTASRRSDLFSLGVLAHELLTGRQPFRGPDWLETARRLLYDEPPALALLRPDLPPQLAAIAGRALAKRPLRRGAASALAAALGPAPPPPETPPPALSRAMTRVTATVRVAAAAAGSRAGSTAAGVIARCRRSPAARWRAIAAVAAMALLAAGALVLLRHGREAALSERVAALLVSGDPAGAERIVREASDGRGFDPLAQKLLGDIACARGAHAECLRRYRAALDSRRFGSDPILRRNALALLTRPEHRSSLVPVLAKLSDIEDLLVAATRSERYSTRWNAVRALEARREGDRVDYAAIYALDLLHGGKCATRRAAAAKLAWLRDPRVVPQLERAQAAVRRSFAERFCLGDAVERALEATRPQHLARR